MASELSPEKGTAKNTISSNPQNPGSAEPERLGDQSGDNPTIDYSGVKESTHWLRTRIRGKFRAALAWAFGLSLFLFARTAVTQGDAANNEILSGFFSGIFIISSGVALRVWASGYLLKDVSPAVSGPYGFVRNPLYLGTYLMALGSCLLVKNVFLAAVLSALYFGVYHYIVLDEEEKLIQMFGDSYQKYLRSVPRFFPRFIPLKKSVAKGINPNAFAGSFSFKLAMKNKAYEAIGAGAALVVFVAAAKWFWLSRV